MLGPQSRRAGLARCRWRGRPCRGRGRFPLCRGESRLAWREIPAGPVAAGAAGGTGRTGGTRAAGARSEAGERLPVRPGCRCRWQWRCRTCAESARRLSRQRPRRISISSAEPRATVTRLRWLRQNIVCRCRCRGLFCRCRGRCWGSSRDSPAPVGIYLGANPSPGTAAPGTGGWGGRDAPGVTGKHREAPIPTRGAAKEPTGGGDRQPGRAAGAGTGWLLAQAGQWPESWRAAAGTWGKKGGGSCVWGCARAKARLPSVPPSRVGAPRAGHGRATFCTGAAHTRTCPPRVSAAARAAAAARALPGRKPPPPALLGRRRRFPPGQRSPLPTSKMAV